MITEETILKTAEQELTRIKGFPVTLKIRSSNATQIQRLKEAVCEAFNTEWENIPGTSKKYDRPLARSIFCYIAFTELGMTLQSIADIMKFRDHSAVIYHRNTVINFLDRADPLVTSSLRRVKQFMYE